MGYYEICNCMFFLNLHGHDLRLFWSSLSRFKLSLPQFNVPVVFNAMSGRLSGFPSLFWRYLCIRYESYNYWSDSKVQTYGRKSRGTLCSVPRKLTKATPGGVKVNLADKIIVSYYLFQRNLFICIVLHYFFRLQQVDVSHTWTLIPVIFSMFCRKVSGAWLREHHAFTPQNPLTV